MMTQQSGKTAILVAERSPVARQSLSELFRDYGYQVLEAADSVAANRHINSNNKLNVILIDLDMPGWDSVIKLARESTPAAYVLCMVGYLSTNEVQEAERIGVHGHLLKPLDFGYLHQSIQSLLAGKGRAEASMKKAPIECDTRIAAK